MKETVKTKQDRNRKLLVYGLIAAVLMFAFGYALVPFYDVLCRALGINGKTSEKSFLVAKSTAMDKSRSIRVEFLTNKNAQLPWQFTADKKSIELHPGENKVVYFSAKNDSDKTMTVQAIPSVSPSVAATYIRKTECFCFEQQTLAAGTSVKMPVLFHIAKDLPESVHTVTLSYTLFDAGKFKREKKAA